MSDILLDTNVILRFLRRDDPDQSPRAAALIESAVNNGSTLRIGWHVIAESVWALRHHYNAPREGIANSLKQMIGSQSIACDDKPVVLDALLRYGSTTLDIVDCLLAAESAASGKPLATFDQGIGKQIRDVVVLDWDGTDTEGAE